MSKYLFREIKFPQDRNFVLEKLYDDPGASGWYIIANGAIDLVEFVKCNNLISLGEDVDYRYYVNP